MVWSNLRVNGISASTDNMGVASTTLPITINTLMFKAVETTTRIALNGIAYGISADEFGWYKWNNTSVDNVGFRLFVIGY